MKKLIVLLLFILSTSLLLAQTNQVRIVLKNGTAISGILKSFDSSSHAIVIISGLETKIPIDNISYIDDKSENQPVSIVVENQQDKDAVAHIDREKLKNFKVFLLGRGNNVYVYGDDNDYCKVGVANLRKLLKKDGFWNVVNSIEDAHFTLSYSVNFWRRDHVTLSVSSWRTNESFLLKVSKQWGMENVDKHANIALGLYQTEIVPLQTSIDEGKVKRTIKKKFTVE